MKIYSDMDGVLADFFGALAQEYFVDHWKDIEDIDEVLEEYVDSYDDEDDGEY